MSKDNYLLGACAALVSGLVMLPNAFAGEELAKGSPAFKHALRGAYGFSLSQSCVRAPFFVPPAAGFDPITRRLLVDAELVSGYGTGQLKFAKDGVVTLEDGHLTEITASQLSAGNAPVSDGTHFGCTGSYNVQPGSKLGVSLSCTVVTPAGSPTVKLEPLNFEGFIAEDKGSINLSTVKPEIHTVTVSNGGVILQRRERICLQSMILDKI